MLLADCFGGRLIGLHVTPDASVPPYFKPSAIERIARIYTTNAHAAAKRAEALFRNETKRTGAPVVWECISGVMDERIAERARFADLLVIGQFDAENPPSISSFSLPAKVVFDSASPIIVVPNERDTGDIGKHIVAAWDGSPEAARAIRDAIPLLRRAKRVMLLAVDPDEQGHIPGGADALQMADHLLRHGVEAIVEEISSSGSNHGRLRMDIAKLPRAAMSPAQSWGRSPVRWGRLMGWTGCFPTGLAFPAGTANRRSSMKKSEPIGICSADF